MEIIPGPDFPTGGIICGRQGILDGYATGRGKVTLRARADIREENNGTQIIITEVPYQQTRNRLAEAIGELVKDERIKGIRDIRDESSARNGEPVRLVLYLKRDADPNLILNQLYQYSPLEKTVSIILLALVDGRPRSADAQADAGGVRPPSRLGDPPPHRVPDARGQAARARPRRPAHRHLVAGRGHRHLPPFAEPGRGEGALAGSRSGGRPS